MSKVSELKFILTQQLSWHKSRIDFFARATIAKKVHKVCENNVITTIAEIRKESQNHMLT